MTTLRIEAGVPRDAACLSAPGAIARIARREFRDAAAGRWFLLYTIGLAVLAIGVWFMSLSRTEVIQGKCLGLGLALCCSVWLGFGLSAGVAVWRAGSADVDEFLLLVLFTCAVSLAMLSVGVLISVMPRRVGIATGLGLFVWIVLVFLSDLGLMAGTLIFKLPSRSSSRSASPTRCRHSRCRSSGR